MPAYMYSAMQNKKINAELMPKNVFFIKKLKFLKKTATFRTLWRLYIYRDWKFKSLCQYGDLEYVYPSGVNLIAKANVIKFEFIRHHPPSKGRYHRVGLFY